MGKNYFNSTVDIVTNLFDILETKHLIGKNRKQSGEIRKIASRHRATVNKTIRSLYSQCSTEMKQVKKVKPKVKTKTKSKVKSKAKSKSKSRK